MQNWCPLAFMRTRRQLNLKFTETFLLVFRNVLLSHNLGFFLGGVLFVFCFFLFFPSLWVFNYSGCFPGWLVPTNNPFFVATANERETAFKHIGFFILQIHILQEKNKKVWVNSVLTNKKHSCWHAAWLEVGGGIICFAGRCLLTTEKQLIAPVRSWQRTNVFYPMAHYPGKVASVAEASHNDAVQVHGLDEGAEESALEPKDVPPEKK